MAMNLFHRLRCSSENWAATVESDLLPWALADVNLGPQTLEIGPGYGATLRALLDRAACVTAVEVDSTMADRLNRLYGSRGRIIHGDGTETELPDNHFSSVVCFTMLHHIPTVCLQNRLFGEALRVLQPGGVFAGSDTMPSLSFRLKHIGDIYNPITPEDLARRLREIGFTDVQVDVAGIRQKWRANAPR